MLIHARTNDLTDDFHSKLAETNVLICLFRLLENHNLDVQQLSVNAIIILAEFGNVQYHFVLYED